VELNLSSRVRLNDGTRMPWFGLGVWSIPPRKTAGAVVQALGMGYRLIDTAKLYGNEREVGVAVRESGLPRDEVHVTTKLRGEDQGYETALAAAERSREALGLGPIDSYLIHWPTNRRRESWKALEALQKRGVCRSIGVSNYSISDLEELLNESSVVPAVNQVEFHPWAYDRGLLEYCRRHGIALEAYSPLVQGRGLRDPAIRAMAAKHARTSSQVLLRWGLQHGCIVIPKSDREDHLRENAAVFDFVLSDKEMAALDALGEAR